MLRIAVFIVAAVLSGLGPAANAAGSGASCEWRAPAQDPFRGDVPGAVDDYRDIPAETRKRLKSRMARFAYDDIVAIRRDAIEGNFSYEPALLDMHFGRQRLCGQVTRQSWRADHEERGLTYCEDGHCIVVPLVCRNVSRIIRRPGVGLLGGPGGAPAHPLSFDAPAAGLPPGPGTANPEPPTTHTLEAPPPPHALPPSTNVPPTTAPPLGLPPATETPPTTAPPPLPAVPTSPPEAPPVVDTPPSVPPALPPQEPEPPPLPPLPGMPPLPPAPAVPEPASWLMWLGGLGVAVLWGRARRRRSTPTVGG